MVIGETIGGYRIVARLGEGGMGAVYLAEHTRLPRKAAMKVLRSELSSNAGAVERLFAEARATALIRHPGIVQVFDCNVEDGRAYIAMEHLEGETLASLLAGGGAFAAEIPVAVALAGKIAAALGAAHQRGLVHRDVKPENVFVVHEDPAGTVPAVKVLDFGVARFVAGGGEAQGGGAAATAFLGTPAYMSPEQCRGTGAAEVRSDLYALGCVLFEMLAGRPPFVCASPGEYIAAHIGTPAPSARSLLPALPPALDELLKSTLAKEPQARPATAAALVAGLERAVGVSADRFDAVIAGSPLLAAARRRWQRARRPGADEARADLLAAGRVGRETVDMPVEPARPPAAAPPTLSAVGQREPGQASARPRRAALAGAGLLVAAVAGIGYAGWRGAGAPAITAPAPPAGAAASATSPVPTPAAALAPSSVAARPTAPAAGTPAPASVGGEPQPASPQARVPAADADAKVPARRRQSRPRPTAPDFIMVDD
jgi:serine/threonine-protein kinase